ncbi:DUF3465 domain-containing protein [Neisseria zalophi]|uniref:DUF3465 domain-containing protein n=1 Tax=Neisseria zalophi TaxID=640030 RepID=A0A5J6PY36_9NEIS|nr:DUF3465 domain-containing protein [Neisseria zalophi]QEY26033.1 DUF3465 domain-containing protein [Neisseria zalophi]
MNKRAWIGIAIALIAGGYKIWNKSQPYINKSDHSVEIQQPGIIPSSAEDILQAAFERQQSDIQIEGSGQVTKTLPDDNKGSRHQRFILKLASGQTLLVAHNIDLAPKIKGLKKGDTVSFYGEYEWSKQGGVIHWTHHDPQGRHADGWLKHKGIVYQ